MTSCGSTQSAVPGIHDGVTALVTHLGYVPAGEFERFVRIDKDIPTNPHERTSQAVFMALPKSPLSLTVGVPWQSSGLQLMRFRDRNQLWMHVLSLRAALCGLWGDVTNAWPRV